MYRVLFYLFFLIIIHIIPSWTYKFETCCSNEKTENKTVNSHLLSCPLNFVIKLNAVTFYTGNGCAPSTCQRRLNKHYLNCNNHRICSISIKCIRMDSSICPWLTHGRTYAQHLIVNYDCILYKPEPPLIALSRLNSNKKKDKNNKSKYGDSQKTVLFSAKINIESPPDILNNSIPTQPDMIDDESAWRDFLLKQYLNDKQSLLTKVKKPIIIQQQRSLFSDTLRTVLILIVFTFILIVLMLVGRFLHKRITLLANRNCFGCHKKQRQKREPFPSDEAYDNLKASAADSTTDSGAATNV